MGALSPATEASTWAEEVDPTLEEEPHAFDDEPSEVTEFELETLDMADKQEVTTKVVRDWRRRPCGGCSSSMSWVGYRPRFETWVRIPHFPGLSILQRAGWSSSNLWGSKVHRAFKRP